MGVVDLFCGSCCPPVAKAVSTCRSASEHFDLAIDNRAFTDVTMSACLGYNGTVVNFGNAFFHIGIFASFMHLGFFLCIPSCL